MRGGLAAATVAVVAVLSAACTADPPPPVRESAAPATPTQTTPGQTIQVATDSIGVGLNPHLLADQSPVTTAVAAATLPSAFVPVSTPTGVELRIDPAVLIGAEVTSQSPFTVTYRIAQDAQWSDGLPVTADDFAYLWQQMSRQPGTIAPAGYRMIDDVASRAGGKEAVVRFRGPYPAWRELFTAMLPSHVLRGVPDGFQSGMDTGLPVSAGRYTITVIDSSRDEVRMQRNDRYWRTPAVVDQIVLHRVGTPTQLAESVRSGDTGVVALAGGTAVSGALDAIPGVSVGRSPVGRVLELTANTRSSLMGDAAVRRAVLGMVDPQVVTDAAAGESVVTPVANPVLVPTDPGYFPVDRARPDAATIGALLAGSGWRPTPSAVVTASRDPSAGPSPTSSVAGAPGDGAPTTTTPTSAAEAGSAARASLPVGVVPLQRDGRTLTVRIGVVAGDVRTRAAADTVADQLRSAGVAADVSALSSSDLYGRALTDPDVDLVVGWSDASVSAATRFASSVTCDPTPASTSTSRSSGSSGSSAATTPSTTPTTTTRPSGSAPSTTGSPDDGDGAGRFPSSLAGLCDPTLSAIAERALTAVDPSADLRAAEPVVAAQSVRLPIFQDSMLTAIGPGVGAVPLDGPVGTGIFGAVGSWNVLSR
ncbi:ABC transporter family substrate-binding protein [Williamsia deligens]|uniref:ABC transporter family substrate-binding protein n=1 Tax=Williamsia deligens TaxID=321325 RepID=A0ABW3G1T8_9NOCA|nr:ABC transporter family substrate-binding protein [Williamsia deligens]MCP2194968.1 ABC-type transport system, substrate-binding protein [Williamsia deligens]